MMKLHYLLENVSSNQLVYKNISYGNTRLSIIRMYRDQFILYQSLFTSIFKKIYMKFENRLSTMNYSEFHRLQDLLLLRSVFQSVEINFVGFIVTLS